MAGRNAINKPKIKMLAQSHAKSLGKKRASRRTIATRSSTSRYDKSAAPKPTESKAVALYSGQSPAPVSIMTTNTLSNKRAKKIARNQKYITKSEEMAEDVKQSNLDLVKQTLWKVIENHENFGYSVKPDSEGTTLGIQTF